MAGRARFFTGSDRNNTLPGTPSYGVRGKKNNSLSSSGKRAKKKKEELHPETIEARKKVKKLREKKARRGERRMQREIDAAREKLERGEYTKKQFAMRIKQIESEYEKKAGKRKKENSDDGGKDKSPSEKNKGSKSHPTKVKIGKNDYELWKAARKKNDDVNRAVEIGTTVISPEYGKGQVVIAEGKWITVLFPKKGKRMRFATEKALKGGKLRIK